MSDAWSVGINLLTVFTGLVQTLGTLVEVAEQSQAKRLVVQSDLAARDLQLGASVAIDGVCLTVTRSDDSGRFEVEAAFETLRATMLGHRAVGDRLNLEPSLRMGDPLGGHLVMGHVDGVARLRSSAVRGDARELWFEPSAELLRFVAPKGSVCLDGVSLTVNAVDDCGFVVGIIPHTLAVTTLSQRSVGDAVNIEVDVLARYAARLLDPTVAAGRGETVTKDLLRESGFIAEGT